MNFRNKRRLCELRALAPRFMLGTALIVGMLTHLTPAAGAPLAQDASVQVHGYCLEERDSVALGNAAVSHPGAFGRLLKKNDRCEDLSMYRKRIASSELIERESFGTLDARQGGCVVTIYQWQAAREHQFDAYVFAKQGDSCP